MQKFSFVLLGLLLPGMASALGVHQHGVAQLEVVLEPPLLGVTLHSPLANLLGFEYAPATAREQARWHELQQQLRNAGQQLVLPAAAGCRLESVELVHPFAGHNNDHDHDHDHDHAHAHDHADLAVDYLFRCSQAQHLRQLQLPLLGNFPAIERLQVRLLMPSGQHQHELSGGQQELPLP